MLDGSKWQKLTLPRMLEHCLLCVERYMTQYQPFLRKAPIYQSMIASKHRFTASSQAIVMRLNTMKICVFPRTGNGELINFCLWVFFQTTL